MQSAMILMLCMHYYLKWLRMMKLLIQMLPIQMMKKPLRSLYQKTPTTKSILIHKIGLHMMKNILKTRRPTCLLQEINSPKEYYYFNFASNIQNAPKDPISAITSNMPKVATRQCYNLVPYARKWFPILCHNSADTICYKNNNFGFPKWFPTFWAKKENYYSLLLFTCHYSLVLFTVTVHSEFLPI